jgi:YVTN family beta-propeller protein
LTGYGLRMLRWFARRPARRPGRISFVAGLALLPALATGALAAPAPAARVWVSAEDAGEIAAVDPIKGEVAFRVKVGRRPRGLKLSPDGKLLYVTLTGTPKADPHGAVAAPTAGDRAADGVAVVDVATRKVVRVLPAGQAPIALDLSPNGKTAYVANGETAEITVLDLGRGTITKKIPVGQEPTGVTVRPDGKIVYVATSATSEVYAIDAVNLELVTRVNAGSRPRSVVFSRDGATAFAIDEQFSELSLLDGRRHVLVGHVSLRDPVKTVFVPQPYAGVLSPDGKRLFVSGGSGQSVFVVDVATRKVVRAIEDVGRTPRGIGVSRDGRKLFTANGASNDVTIVDVVSGKIDRRVGVGGAPWDLVVGRGATRP